MNSLKGNSYNPYHRSFAGCTDDVDEKNTSMSNDLESQELANKYKENERVSYKEEGRELKGTVKSVTPYEAGIKDSLIRGEIEVLFDNGLSKRLPFSDKNLKSLEGRLDKSKKEVSR